MFLLPLKALLLLKNNWKYIKALLIVFAIVAIILTPYFIGRADGKREYKAKCNARIELMMDAAAAEVERLNKEADDKAQDYIEDKKQTELKLTVYKEKYENERKKITAYTICHAGPEFMRYYKAIGYHTSE